MVGWADRNPAAVRPCIRRSANPPIRRISVLVRGRAGWIDVRARSRIVGRIRRVVIVVIGLTGPVMVAGLPVLDLRPELRGGNAGGVVEHHFAAFRARREQEYE